MPSRRLQFYPYTPNRPEWKQLPWDAARAIDRRVTGFIGHDDNFFVFQIRGVNKEIRIPKKST